MKVMNAKMEKDLRNHVNRRMNCDTANLDKALAASKEQLRSIKKLEAAGRLDGLPEKLKQTAAFRMEYPEYSL